MSEVPTSLDRYVRRLVDELAAGAPSAFARMQQVVGRRRALVVLEDEAIAVWFGDDGAVQVEPAPVELADVALLAWAGAVDGFDGIGRTSHDVVRAVLDGRLEATDAILDGDVEVRGSTEAVTAMMIAIEILIDAATRVPAVRRVSETYRAEHPAPIGAVGSTRRRRIGWPPTLFSDAEDELLAELGLDNGGASSTMD